MISTLTIAMEEGNLNKFIESFGEAQKLGLHKELNIMKYDFIQRKVLKFHIFDEDFYLEISSNMQDLIIDAKKMDLKEEKIKVNIIKL